VRLADLSVATPAISLPLDDDGLPHRDASEAFAEARRCPRDDFVTRVVAAERDQARESLLEEQRLAALGRLAAGVGHELRNPLTSVKMLVQTGLEDDQLLSKADLSVSTDQKKSKTLSIPFLLYLYIYKKYERRRVKSTIW
jgi:signal transduction histidine kinase